MPRKRRSPDWTERAERALESIRAHSAKDKPMAADRFVARVKRAVEGLRRFPHVGELLARDDDSELREIFVRPCRVFFRVREGTIRIIAIVHVARNFDVDMLGDIQ